MATRTTTTKSGGKITVKLERTVVDDVAYADGYNIKIGRSNHEWREIIVTLPNGTYQTGRTVTPLNPKYDAKALGMGAVARLNTETVLGQASYDFIIAAMAELEAEVGKSAEWLAIEQAEAEKQARGEENDRRIAAEMKQREQRPGWCKRCQDYTYGDCGH